MAFTLIINPGSSSKKFALYSSRTLLLEAYVERIADGFEMCTSLDGEQQKCSLLDHNEYNGSLGQFLDNAVQRNMLASYADVTKVALRVVAPGTFFQSHRMIDEEYIHKLENLTKIAPLHIPHLLQEITATKQLLPHALLVGISDSAFHGTMPDLTRRYSIPEADAAQFDIFHFGYHGLSVASVLARADSVAREPLRKVIVCHIGSGVSVTAVKNGKSVDTSMGYAPGSGLLMGSRAGDVPTGALLSLMQQKNLKPADALVYLQTHSGLKGLTGESDLRILLERRAQGHAKATAAIDSFIYHLQKAIGGYLATLGGADAIILTATASQRSPQLRQMLLQSLAPLGIMLDIEKNDATINKEAVISTNQSPIKVLVIKTNEADEILKNSELFW